MKKTNEDGATHAATVLLVVVIVITSFIGWSVWQKSQKTKDSETSNPQPTVGTTDYITFKEWGVRFPIGKVGKYSYQLPSSDTETKPSATQGGPSDMQSVYVGVSGFTKDENSCTDENGEVLGLGSVYRHKEQNPTITYSTTSQLNPTAQVKIGDWYYSTLGLSSSGNCFDGKTVSSGYTKLQSEYLENFKKLTTY